MNTNIFRARYALVATFGLVALVAQPATAQTTTGGTMVANAVVTPDCVVSATALNFGNTNVTDGQQHTGTANLNVVCTSGTAWSATADKGLGATADITMRQMQSGSNNLNYSLYTTPAAATVWGDGTTGSALTGIGTGQSQTTTVTGMIPANQTTLPAGTYTDTVTVTVTY
jgi:spore coat protein U-like protein